MTTTIDAPTTTTDASADRRSRPHRARRRLIGAIRSELVRMKRLSFSGIGAGLIAFFAAMATLVTFLAADQAPAGGGPFGSGITDLASPDGAVAGLIMAADLVGIVALSLWAAAVASDYATGWIRVMVQAEPRRWRLLAGKFVALVGLTIIGTLLATVVSVGLAPLLAGATGVSTAAWSTGIVGTVASTWLNMTISVIAWGVIGYAVAVVTRSAVVAIAGGIGYLLVFEGLLGLVAESAVTYLPGSVLGTVVAGGTASLSYGAALVIGGLYVAAAVIVVIVVFHRRDITS